MSYPLSVENDGIKIKPEQMKIETIYHCIFQNKIIIIYKDQGQVLNCYEIDEAEIVSKVKASNKENIENILEEYIEKENLKKNS
jgi:hypothetical protein